MRRYRVAMVMMTALTLALAGAALAHEEHEHAMGGQHHDEADEGVQTLTGEVIDVACYLGHGAMGPGHADCAQKCIKSGLPVAIKVCDELLLAVKSDHTPMNAELAPLAGKQVQVTGEVNEKDGVHLIAIKNVKAL